MPILAACRRVRQVGWPRKRTPNAISILAACRRVLQVNLAMPHHNLKLSPASGEDLDSPRRWTPFVAK
jgi:hypothetical protein